MVTNKVIYDGNVLIDLTGDTVTASDILSGKTAHDKSGATITGTCEFDVNSTDATASVSEILSGKTAYVRGTKLTGDMVNNGAIEGFITERDTAFVVPIGFHDGSGTVGLNDADKAKLIAENIRKDIMILGIIGTMTGREDITAQAKNVTPSSSEQVITPDTGYDYLSQVTVAAIPYVETENAAGGITVTIG